MVPRFLLVLLLTFLTAGSGVALAAEPPNQNDPCSRNGRDSCGTTGKGSYRTYKYGVRWFGDYRRAVPDVDGATFCIDLRFWYPGKDFGYEARSSTGLKNKEGDKISASSLRRMNRALWRYGRSDNATQQAAVMVYVHRLMGDGEPGEADPKALSAASQRVYANVVRDAERWSGPYKVQVKLPEAKLVAGRAAEATVEVLTAGGRRVPNVDVTLKITGGEAAETLNTGASGLAKAAVTPSRPGHLTVEAGAEDLPSETPTLYVPTRGAAKVNGQRLVTASTTLRTAKVAAPVQAQPALSTQISAQSTAPGASITDTVKVAGLAGQTVTIQAALYGPYPSREAIKCAEAPVWTGTITATGDGDYVTAPVTLDTPGYYTYREWIEETDSIARTETACAEVSETTVVRGTPAITTQISAQETTPGASITDTVVVTGLGKLGATVNVELWGPFPTREAITCEGTPFWTGTLAVNGDGSYVTAPAVLGAAGYYTYREGIAESESIAAVTTACAEVSETTIARAAPKVTTVVSNAVVKPGDELFDTLNVTGLGKTPATVVVDLFGPYASRADIDCAGAPSWSGEVEVTGDGKYESPKAEVRRTGFFVFRERIAGSETVTATQGECLNEAETSLAAPLILGGRGDTVAEVRVSQASSPKRLKLARLGIDAAVSAVGIDLKAGALGIPADIKKVGWWRDGAAPGAANGTVLIGGHVDSAKKGAGAFYPLKSARRGDIVTVDSRRYRVTTVKIVRKEALPTSIYTRTGPARLVLVTCGGPFNAKTGHYRDNVIVTATPVR